MEPLSDLHSSLRSLAVCLCKGAAPKGLRGLEREKQPLRLTLFGTSPFRGGNPHY